MSGNNLDIYNKYFANNLVLFSILLFISIMYTILSIIIIWKKHKQIFNDITKPNIYKGKLSFFIFNLVLTLLVVINIYYINRIKLDINYNNEIIEDAGVINRVIEHGHFLIIDKKIYPVMSLDYDKYNYHKNNGIEVKFYYYKYSKCTQSIELARNTRR